MTKRTDTGMDTNYADRSYQRSLFLVYLKSVRDVLGPDARVNLFNSLSRGLYTEIDCDKKINKARLDKIRERMQYYVDADMPITSKVFGKKTLDTYLDEIDENSGSIELLKGAPGISKVAVYELDGYSNFFYGNLRKSTGGLKLFDIVPYMDGVLLRYPHPSDPKRLPNMPGDYKLFAAFKEGWYIAELCGLRFVADLNTDIEQGQSNEIIALSERFHKAKTRRVAEMIHEKHKKVILVAGPSSSGKTTFSKRLINQLSEIGTEPLYLGTDDYFINRKDIALGPDGKPDFESVNAIDIELFDKNITDMLDGKEADLPIFDFIKGEKQFGKRFTTLEEDQPVVVEGLHALNPLLYEKLPDKAVFKVYISPLTQLNLDDHNRIPTTDIRLIRRILRDVRTRGYTPEHTINTWQKVREGENVYVFPYCDEADIVFNSALLYELPVLKRHAESLLKCIKKESEAYEDALRLLDFLSLFRVMDKKDEAAIPRDSILREFIGGGFI